MPKTEIGAMATPADHVGVELLAAVKRCVGRPNLPLGLRPIPNWNPVASILITGQALSSRTHYKGISFDDPKGERLRDLMGVDRETSRNLRIVAIVPMARCFPETGKSGDLPPPSRCAHLWREPLLELVALPRPGP